MADNSGDFSKNLLSLQLQLRTLLEDVGGESVLPLLDAMATLRKAEQEILIRTFLMIVRRYSQGERLLESADEATLKKFEEDLYQDLTQALETARPSARHPLEVLSGGKTRRRVVSLAEARARKERQLLQ